MRDGNVSWTLKGTSIIHQLNRLLTVNCDFFGLAINVQGEVLQNGGEPGRDHNKGALVEVCGCHAAHTGG